jgi:hypothetical protein
MLQTPIILRDSWRPTPVQKVQLYPASTNRQTKIHNYLRMLEREKTRSYVIQLSMYYKAYFLHTHFSLINEKLPCLSDGLAFRISSTHEILESQIYLQHSTPVSEYDRPSATIVTFPVYRIAVLLFQSYESSTDHICRILHIPTIRSLIQTFYLLINQNESVPSSQAALLLSIFALAAFSYRSFDHSEVTTTEKDTVHLSKVLSKGALDVLDHSRRNTSGSWEYI